ncbi:MAG: hypothetical protein ACOC1K_04540 [Nanoarchaeota archaeon]
MCNLNILQNYKIKFFLPKEKINIESDTSINYLFSINLPGTSTEYYYADTTEPYYGIPFTVPFPQNEPMTTTFKKLDTVTY